MENEQTEIQASVVKLKDELTSTKTKNTELEEENMNLKSRLATQTSTLLQTVNVLTADLKQTITRAETCVVNEKRAKELCDEQKTLAAEV